MAALALISLISLVPATAIHVLPGAGYGLADYAELEARLNTTRPGLCFAHSAEGAIAAVSEHCEVLVHYGGAPLTVSKLPTLVVGSTHDGVFTLAQFAVARHLGRYCEHCKFVLLEGAAHASVVSAEAPTHIVASQDLAPARASSSVQTELVTIIQEFLGAGEVGQNRLQAGLELAAMFSDPMVAALKLEGSEALGVEACNSDFPTNPDCAVYPKYPDFSLGFPAPAPSPLPPSDCVCGSTWVTDYASPFVAGTDVKTFDVVTADAFHDVSDTNPFHLPHIWDTCEAGSSSCTLNITTLTMPIVEDGPSDIFPSTMVSALEMRTKLKSREVTWEAAGFGTQDGDVDKTNMTVCRGANEMAYEWALANADASIRERHLASGEKLVMVDDEIAPIGITGPTWIKNELDFKRTDAGVEIKSWTFIVGSSPIDSKFIPAGMHYCKLLSPARAMEWIMTDGFRA